MLATVRAWYLGHCEESSQYLHMSKWVSEAIHGCMANHWRPLAQNTWWYASSSFTYTLIGIYVYLKSQELATACGPGYGLLLWRWEAFFLICQGFISYASDVRCFGLTWYVARLDQIWASSLFCLQLCKAAMVTMDQTQITIYAVALVTAVFFFVSAQICHWAMVHLMEIRHYACEKLESGIGDEDFVLLDEHSKTQERPDEVHLQQAHTPSRGDKNARIGVPSGAQTSTLGPQMITQLSAVHQESMDNINNSSSANKNDSIPNTLKTRKSFAYDHEEQHAGECVPKTRGVVGGVTCPTPKLPSAATEVDGTTKNVVPASSSLAITSSLAAFAFQVAVDLLLPISELFLRAITSTSTGNFAAAEPVSSPKPSDEEDKNRQLETRLFQGFMFYHTLWHYSIPFGAFLWVWYTTNGYSFTFC
ncbi:unnamed protein product [Amoebophrya sp. A120]|nr:unnamed protein product [Amoebophrya sp. A120]|eukprot:GSA120T00010912001.1